MNQASKAARQRPETTLLAGAELDAELNGRRMPASASAVEVGNRSTDACFRPLRRWRFAQKARRARMRSGVVGNRTTVEAPSSTYGRGSLTTPQTGLSVWSRVSIRCLMPAALQGRFGQDNRGH